MFDLIERYSLMIPWDEVGYVMCSVYAVLVLWTYRPGRRKFDGEKNARKRGAASKGGK
jgi:hypothetical protein